MSISETMDSNHTCVPSPPVFQDILKYPVPDDPYDFITMLCGWIPVIGHALGLYNLAAGRKKRGIFLLLYATLTPFIMLPFMIYSTRCIRFFSPPEYSEA